MDRQNLTLMTDLYELTMMQGYYRNKDRNRIGYGGGFYDRFISKHTGLYRIGVCFEDQICDHIPVEENDFSMNSVVTEVDIY